MTSDTGSVLTISGLEPKDAGSIKCVISNKNGSDQSSAKLSTIGQFNVSCSVNVFAVCHIDLELYII